MTDGAHEAALEAERAVLGALLLHADALADVRDLQPPDFYLPRHALIYSAVISAHAEAGTTDPIAVEAELARRGRLDDAGGREELLNLLECVVGAQSVAYHAALVMEQAQRRRLAEMLRETAARLREGANVAEVLAEARPRLDAIEQGAAAISRGARAVVAVAWEPWAPGALSVKPHPRRWLLRHRTCDGKPVAPGLGDGLLLWGVAGMLTASGGTGKTTAAIGLAVALITGRPWFGCFDGPALAERGKVLLVLAEEDREEAHRRVFDACQSMSLDADERALVERSLVVLGLRGRVCALLEGGLDGVTETLELLELRRRLKADGPWMLVVLDPSARLAGIDAESSNVLATRWAQAVESLCDAPGNPTVLVLGHSSKAARLMGKADARGVSGQEDAFRWAATLNGKGESVEFKQTKSNYSRPMLEPLVLRRLAGGVLRAQTDAEREAQEQTGAASVDADIELLVVALRAEGEATSIRAVTSLAGIQRQRGGAAFAVALTRGLIVNLGTVRKPRYVVAGDAAPESARYNPTPPERVTRSGACDGASIGVPGVPDAFREGSAGKTRVHRNGTATAQADDDLADLWGGLRP